MLCNGGSSDSIALNRNVGQEMEGIARFVLDEASVISCSVWRPSIDASEISLVCAISTLVVEPLF